MKQHITVIHIIPKLGHTDASRTGQKDDYTASQRRCMRADLDPELPERSYTLEGLEPELDPTDVSRESNKEKGWITLDLRNRQLKKKLVHTS